jgi:hypothetical protein
MDFSSSLSSSAPIAGDDTPVSAGADRGSRERRGTDAS